MTNSTADHRNREQAGLPPRECPPWHPRTSENLAAPDWGSDLRDLKALDLDAIKARAEAFDDAWGWHEQTDDTLAGHGHHMMQMLYRLPRDGQTRDMQASIEAMLTDVPALIAEVEQLRDAATLATTTLTRLLDGLHVLSGLPPEVDDVDVILGAITARAEMVEVRAWLASEEAREVVTAEIAFGIDYPAGAAYGAPEALAALIDQTKGKD